MNHNLSVNRVKVLDENGNELAPMYANRAMKYVYRKKAVIVSENPLTIRLLCATKDNEVTLNDQ